MQQCNKRPQLRAAPAVCSTNKEHRVQHTPTPRAAHTNTACSTQQHRVQHTPTTRAAHTNTLSALTITACSTHQHRVQHTPTLRAAHTNTMCSTHQHRVQHAQHRVQHTPTPRAAYTITASSTHQHRVQHTPTLLSAHTNTLLSIPTSPLSHARKSPCSPGTLYLSPLPLTRISPVNRISPDTARISSTTLLNGALAPLYTLSDTLIYPSGNYCLAKVGLPLAACGVLP